MHRKKHLSTLLQQELTLWYSTISSIKSKPSGKGIATPRFVHSRHKEWHSQPADTQSVHPSVLVLTLTVNYRNHRHLQHCLQRSLERNQLTDKNIHTGAFTVSSTYMYLYTAAGDQGKTLSLWFLCITIRNNNLFTYCQRLQSRLVREDFEPGIKRKKWWWWMILSIKWSRGDWMGENPDLQNPWAELKSPSNV